MDPANLSDALQVFRHAGREALAGQAAQTTWWHAYLHFTDWANADRTFTTHVLPLLRTAEADGAITGWWYTRKHPCWRLRLRRAPGARTMISIGDGLDALAAEGHLHRWWSGIYEPETAAFGGPASMDTAHSSVRRRQPRDPTPASARRTWPSAAESCPSSCARP